MLIRRRKAISLIGILLAGCKTPKEFNPKDLTPPVQLQTPPPGKAVLYLLRAPHDSSTLPVYLGKLRVAMLPPGTYTTVVVEPANYLIASSPLGQSESAPASTFTVQAGERRFLYVSASSTGRAVTIKALPLPGGLIPLIVPTYGSSGARTWKECTELDAQGFMSISKPVAPEPRAT
jgi:hypothetical protein